MKTMLLISRKRKQRVNKTIAIQANKQFSEMCCQQNYTKRNAKSGSLDRKRMILDNKIKMQKELRAIGKDT